LRGIARQDLLQDNHPCNHQLNPASRREGSTAVTRLSNIVTILGGAFTAFIGTWGAAAHRGKSTPELQEMTLWISLALLTAGLGLVAVGVARAMTRT
jgi:hypothetical protein